MTTETKPNTSSRKRAILTKDEPVCGGDDDLDALLAGPESADGPRVPVLADADKAEARATTSRELPTGPEALSDAVPQQPPKTQTGGPDGKKSPDVNAADAGSTPGAALPDFKPKPGLLDRFKIDNQRGRRERKHKGPVPDIELSKDVLWLGSGPRKVQAVPTVDEAMGPLDSSGALKPILRTPPPERQAIKGGLQQRPFSRNADGSRDYRRRRSRWSCCSVS